MSRGPGPWPDERLDAAFERRARSRTVPDDLLTETLNRARRTPRPVPLFRWTPRARLAGLAAAGLAMAVVGVSLGPLRSTDRLAQPSPPPGDRGLPVRTIDEALAIRDSGSSQEIAVRGYYSAAPAGVRCGARESTAINPVRLECPNWFGWLLETSAPLDGIRSSLPANRDGFQPLFPGIDMGPLDRAAADVGPDGPLLDVVLVGHFHDRRGDGALCDVPDATRCDGFVVDAVQSIGRVPVETSTVIDLERPDGSTADLAWTTADVDALVTAALPGEILSRVALPGERIAELEPALGTGALGIIDQEAAWLVNILDRSDGVVIVRTMLLVDGDPMRAWQATRVDEAPGGFTPLRLPDVAIRTPRPTIAPSSTPPPTQPAVTPPVPANASFPVEWLGLPVITGSEALAFRDDARTGNWSAVDTELAVRGWLVVPPLRIACTLPRPDIEPLDPRATRCPAGTVWLLDNAEAAWTEADGVRTWKRPIPDLLQPVVPPDVAFDDPVRFPDSALPIPAVLLGHFDPASGWANSPFVVDALVWWNGEPVADRTVVTGAPPDEQRADVESRVNEVLGPARATWAAVVRGAGLESVGLFDPEVLASWSVWHVRRLVEEDGRPVVRSAWTADGGQRVWTADGLAPEERFAIELDDGGPIVVGVVDATDAVEDSRLLPSGTPAHADERVVARDVPVAFLLSNPPDRLNEVRIRWTATDCDVGWTITISNSDGVWLWLEPERTDVCAATPLDIDILLRFAEPVPVESIQAVGGGSGG